MRPKPNRKTIEIPLTTLKPHPVQSQLFSDLSDGELETLAADMTQNGLQVPIHVLPDGTIIRGHQRVRAARKLKWKTIEAVVRDDLAKAGDEAAEADLIADNINRRQLGPFDMVFLVLRLHDLAKRQGGKLDDEGGLLRDQIGRRIGKDGRMVGRYLQAARCQPQILQALSRDQVTLSQACQLASQPVSVQEDFVTRLEAGERASDIIRDLRPTRKRQNRKRCLTPAQCIAKLESCVRELESIAAPAHAWNQHLSGLKNIRIRLKRISSRAEPSQE